jgi:hypothetical protein
VSRWLDLEALRSSIAAAATKHALNAGVENPSVHVHIDLPDKRGRRAIHVVVTSLTKADSEQFYGRNWEDN